MRDGVTGAVEEPTITGASGPGGPYLVALVRAGERIECGMLVERTQKEMAT